MNEIEKRIHRGMNQLAPDVFQNILADTGPKLNSEVWLMEEEHKDSRNFWMRAARTAAVLAVCCVLILGIGVYQLSLKVDSVVEIDVNPSLELQVNRGGRVVRLNALNADGVKILDDTEDNLKHAKLETAIHVLVNTMVEDGFLDEEKNSVLVSVSHGEAAKSAELQQLVAENVKEALDEDQITGIVYRQSYSLDSDIPDIAEKYGISPGKAAFIMRLISMRPELSIEELAKLSISEITGLLQREDVDVSDYVAKNSRRPMPEGTEDALGAYIREHELLKAKLEDEEGIGKSGKVKTQDPCQKESDRESSMVTPGLEENLPADGEIIKDEVADTTQQGSGPLGNGTQGSKPEDQESGGGSTSAGKPGNQPGSGQDQPGGEEKPGSEEPVEGNPEDSDHLGSGGSGDSSHWEDVTGIPAVLRTQIEALTEKVDSLLAQICSIGLMEEGAVRDQAYVKCSALLIEARGRYEETQKQAYNMSVSGELDGYGYQKTLNIFKTAGNRLDKAGEDLVRYAPADVDLGEACPDGK